MEDETPDLADLRNYMWRSGDLSWKLDGLQASIRKAIHDAKAKCALILSSRQIGKSFLIVCMALEWLLKHEKMGNRKIARIIAPTLKQCADIVADNLEPIADDAPAGLVERIKSEYRWKVGKRCELRLGALEREHVNGNRGGNAGLIIYEECGFVRGEDFTYGTKSVLGPQLLRTGGIELYISSPSEDPEHPLHTEILPRCAELGTAFRYTVHDSPSLTPELIREAMDRCGGEDSDSWRREYLAMIIRPRSLVVIPDYDESIHVRAFTEPVECLWQVTLDWGGVKDMTVALLHTREWIHDVDLVWDELCYPPNTPTSTIIQGLRDLTSGRQIHAWYADVPGQLQVDVNDAYQIPLAIPPKSDWKASVTAMATRFTRRKVLIHPRCLFLRQSCRGGIFNNIRTDFARTPALGHMDALAALMYAIRTTSKDDPYAMPRQPDPEKVLSIVRPPPEAAMAEMLVPKSFPGIGRSFGSFRR